MIFKVIKGTVNGILSDLQLQLHVWFTKVPYKPGSDNNKEDIVVFNLEKRSNRTISFFLSAVEIHTRELPIGKKSIFG